MSFDNAYVLSKIEDYKQIKFKKIIEELKLIANLNDDVIMQIYNKSVSLHQSNVCKNGNLLENTIVVDELIKNNIVYKQQVVIDNKGIIIDFNKKTNNCYHIIDFVIGANIEIGKSIADFTVISCKTTCRERWTQDNWTFTYIPKKYILLTLSNDYPTSKRFRECNHRKIITCYSKKKDDRMFKLGYDQLINEIS